MTEVKRLLTEFEGDATITYQGMRIYSSVNPESESDRKLRSWLIKTLGQMPGNFVSVSERRTRPKPIFCSECKNSTELCPVCSKPFKRAPEKDVDSAIITDMFCLYIENVYDIAVLGSADADMIPMVHYLQNRGIKIINLAWDKIGNELKSVCWASIVSTNLRRS